MTNTLVELVRDLLAGNLQTACPLLDYLSEEHDARHFTLMRALGRLTMKAADVMVHRERAATPGGDADWSTRTADGISRRAWFSFANEVERLFWPELNNGVTPALEKVSEALGLPALAVLVRHDMEDMGQ